MRLRISYDDGHTWPFGRALHDAPKSATSCEQDKGGYSSMAPMGPTVVGALVEIADKSRPLDRRSIEFHAVNLSWLLEGRAEPAPQGVPKRRVVRLAKDCPKNVAESGGTPGKCVAGSGRSKARTTLSSTSTELWDDLADGWPVGASMGSWLRGAGRTDATVRVTRGPRTAAPRRGGFVE